MGKDETGIPLSWGGFCRSPHQYTSTSFLVKALAYMTRRHHNTGSGSKMIHAEWNHRCRPGLVEEPDWDPQSNERIGRKHGKPIGVVARIMSNDYALRGNLRASMDVFGKSL